MPAVLPELSRPRRSPSKVDEGEIVRRSYWGQCHPAGLAQRTIITTVSVLLEGHLIEDAKTASPLG